MRYNMRGILTVAFGYAAAVIGAGFASGQEIVSFFVRYGKNGIIGIIIACAAFAMFSYAVLGVCAERKIYSYTGFLKVIFKGTFLRAAAEAAVFVCAAVSMCVMTACAGEVGALSLGLAPIVGAAVFAAACGIVLLMNTRSIMELNSALGAAIITGIIFTCFYILRYREHQTFSGGIPAAVSGFAYAGYNIVGTGAVLAGMSRFLQHKKDAALASAVSGVILFIMITLLWGVLGIYYGQINLGEIPMLTMALRQNKALGIFYGVMLVAAVLSTGISNGFALVDMARKFLPQKNTVLLITLSALAMSGAGFGTLVNTAYKYCGYAGAVIAGIIILHTLLNAKNKEK